MGLRGGGTWGMDGVGSTGGVEKGRWLLRGGVKRGRERERRGDGGGEREAGERSTHLILQGRLNEDQKRDIARVAN